MEIHGDERMVVLCELVCCAGLAMVCVLLSWRVWLGPCGFFSVDGDE